MFRVEAMITRLTSSQQPPSYHSTDDVSSTQTKVAKEDSEADLRVLIPDESEEKQFSFRKLWAFMGPGFLMSIAYLDPGNIESDLQSGAIAGYRLLWVLMFAHILGLLLQRLSARIGVVSGKHMAEIAHEYYPPAPRWLLWLMVEVAIVGSDMQEVIGTAISFYLLTNGVVKLWIGVLITILDTISFLFLDKYGFRKLEAFFGLLITVMAVSFGYEYFAAGPDPGDIAKGMFIPWCQDCDKEQLLQAVGILGAVIMPHNLYLHSALVKSRKVDRRVRARVSEANMYYFVESGIALFCSLIINTFVMGVFAFGLYGTTNEQIHEICLAAGDTHHAFPNTTDPAISDIYHGGIYLGCQYGKSALYVWGIGILAAGQSSTMTGTYAGQFVMEGFMNIRWARWKRVLFTRTMAILPTLALAASSRIDGLTGMNDLLNALMMMQLPFALIPVLTFACSDRIMHDFATGIGFRIGLSFAAVATLAINMYFLFEYVQSNLPNDWYYYVLIAVGAVLYLCFVGYLSLYCLYEMGVTLPCIHMSSWLPRIKDELSIDSPWMSNKSSVEESRSVTGERPTGGYHNRIDVVD